MHLFGSLFWHNNWLIIYSGFHSCFLCKRNNQWLCDSNNDTNLIIVMHGGRGDLGESYLLNLTLLWPVSAWNFSAFNSYLCMIKSGSKPTLILIYFIRHILTISSCAVIRESSSASPCSETPRAGTDLPHPMNLTPWWHWCCTMPQILWTSTIQTWRPYSDSQHSHHRFDTLAVEFICCFF